MNSQGKEVFLRDIWPTREEIQAVERQFVIPAMFKEVYEKVEVLLTINSFVMNQYSACLTKTPLVLCFKSVYIVI